MKKIVLSFLVVFLSLSSIAQVPGYLGKRFSIGYSNYFFPRFPALGSALGFSDDGVMLTEHLMNSTHCLDVDYILGHSASLCVSGQFSKMDLFAYGSKFSLERGGRYSDVKYLPFRKDDITLTTANISVGVKFFKQRFLNPFGRYRKLELILMINKMKMDENGFYTIITDYPNPEKAIRYSLPSGTDAFKSFIFAYTMGKQRVFFDKLILDWGLRLGINYSAVFTNVNPLVSLGDYNDGDDTLEKRLKGQTNVRTFGAQLINAHLGLRFLAF